MQTYILPELRVITMERKVISTKEFIKLVSDKSGYQRKQTEEIMDAMADVVCEIIKENKVLRLRNFGIFSTHTKKAKNRGDFNGGAIKTPQKVCVVFKPGTMLRKIVEEEFNHEI